jgi:hypothetical protein
VSTLESLSLEDDKGFKNNVTSDSLDELNKILNPTMESKQDESKVEVTDKAAIISFDNYIKQFDLKKISEMAEAKVLEIEDKINKLSNLKTF